MITGNFALDRYIGDPPWMTLFYGIAGSGKTSMLLHIAKNICMRNRCIYVSTEETLHYERVAREPDRYTNVFFTEYYDFDELLDFIVTKYYYLPVKTIFVDSINALYREIAYRENSIQKLGLLLGVLKKKITDEGGYVFASAQVRAGYEEDEEELLASGMSILEYWFNTIIKLSYGDTHRYAEIVKPSNGRGTRVFFEITDRGVIWIDESIS